MTIYDNRSFDQRRNLSESEDEIHQTTFDPETDSVSEELINAVATLNDATPDELAILAHFIDPDALDALFRPLSDGTRRDTEVRVSFTYDNYTVEVQQDGTITLHPSDEANDE